MIHRHIPGDDPRVGGGGVEASQARPRTSPPVPFFLSFPFFFFFSFLFFSRDRKNRTGRSCISLQNMKRFFLSLFVIFSHILSYHIV